MKWVNDHKYHDSQLKLEAMAVFKFSNGAFYQDSKK